MFSSYFRYTDNTVLSIYFISQFYANSNYETIKGSSGGVKKEKAYIKLQME